MLIPGQIDFKTKSITREGPSNSTSGNSAQETQNTTLKKTHASMCLLQHYLQ